MPNVIKVKMCILQHSFLWVYGLSRYSKRYLHFNESRDAMLPVILWLVFCNYARNLLQKTMKNSSKPFCDVELKERFKESIANGRGRP